MKKKLRKEARQLGKGTCWMLNSRGERCCIISIHEQLILWDQTASDVSTFISLVLFFSRFRSVSLPESFFSFPLLLRLQLYSACNCLSSGFDFRVCFYLCLVFLFFPLSTLPFSALCMASGSSFMFAAESHVMTMFKEPAESTSFLCSPSHQMPSGFFNFPTADRTTNSISKLSKNLNYFPQKRNWQPPAPAISSYLYFTNSTLRA